jgi:WhiB family redox-sensing transcriptional regulator
MSAASRLLAEAADPRVPAPDFHNAPAACQDQPDRWLPDTYGDRIEIRQAVNICKRCPHAPACLLYALANPALTRHGIWAATNPYKRTQLRERLRQRLGDDWVGTVTGKPARTAP